jgi:hypothetical protein
MFCEGVKLHPKSIFNEMCNHGEDEKNDELKTVSISCGPQILTYVSYLHIVKIGFHGRHNISVIL